MSNPLFKPLPKKFTWTMRLAVYSVILLIAGGLIYGYSLFMIGTYFQDCAGKMHRRGQGTVLDSHKQIMACLEQRANFIERWFLQSEQQILAALPSSPCRYVGTWTAERSSLTSSITLRSDGRYSGSVVRGTDTGYAFSGVWGVHDKQMIWLDENRMMWPMDVNKIVDEGAKGFTLIERDGSRTRYVLSKLPSLGKCANVLATDTRRLEGNGNTEGTGMIVGAASTDNTPAAKGSSGETGALVNTDSVASRPTTTLIADPLPLSLNESLFLYEKSPYAEKVNWVTGETEKIDLPFILKHPVRDKRKKLKRYSLAANKAGLWFAGPALALREPDGNIRVTNFDYNEPIVVGLDDGSLLIFAKSHTDRTFEIFRAQLMEDKQLKLQPLDSAPKLYHGFAAVKLKDGRVLLVGGQYSANEARLFDPNNNSWQATGDMHVRRSNMAMAALPDGRAVVVSSGSSAYAENPNEAAPSQIYGVEIWDPQTNTWSLLPNLPLSYRIDAHHAERPSVAVLPDGSLVVGGGMHRHVLLLRAKGRTFAPYWTVAGTLPGQRINGIVQALGNQEVVVSGGLGPVSDRGGCCKFQAEGNRISWTTDGIHHTSSISLARRGAAVAHGEGMTLAAGGWETFRLGSQSTQASSLAELIDHRSGQVTILPPLPKPLLAGRAMWLDANRVLVKAVAHKKTDPSDLSENIFHTPFGRVLEAGAEAYSAIYNKRQNNWSIFEDVRIVRSELIGMQNEEAILVDPDVKVWAMNVNTNTLRQLPQRILSRRGGAAQIVQDGKIIIAGGLAQTRVLQAFDADCRQADCQKRYFGQGSLKPSQRYEILQPGGKEWRMSAASEAPGESVVIRRNGRVIKLGNNSKKWVIEASNVEGSAWRQLPWPEGLEPSVTANNKTCGYMDSRRNCLLLSGQLDKHDTIFFVHREWNVKAAKFRYNLWVLSEDEKQWLLIKEGMSKDALMATQTLPIQVGAKSVKASNFIPYKLRLWLE